MKLSPKTLPGILHNWNKGACDWGWVGQLAYGCQNLVVVVDPRSMQVIQALDKHRGYVVKVRWARQNYHHDLASPYTLQLASADYNGKIIVWDVGQATIKAEFSDGSRPVADLEWLSSQDGCQDLLVALHPPYSLILWNAATGSKLWKKTYTETLQSFAMDPFESSKIAFLGQECIVFVDDFSVTKVPSSNGKKFYISSPSNQSSSSSSGSGEKGTDKRASKASLTKLMTNRLVGEGTKRSDDEQVTLHECLQLIFHEACRHHLILLYPREILILDLDINQTVGIIPMERTGSPFVQVKPLKQRDVMMCLHESGSVTVRVRRRTNQAAMTPAMEQSQDDGGSICPALDVQYDLRCQSDTLRVTKNNRVFGMVCCPVTETKAALIMSDSRLLIWEMQTFDYQGGGLTQQPLSPLYTPGFPQPMLDFSSLEGHKLPLTSRVPYPKAVLCDLIGHAQTFVMENQTHNKHGVMLKFVLTGLLSGVAPPPLVMRMCPPLTTKNWNIYQPLLALGTSTGAVQVYNLSSGQLYREFSVHTCALRGIEWVSLNSFLSYAYPSPSNGNNVKNELILTDIQTGKSRPFRQNREEESPIEMIRISYLKQYFVIVFKDKPFELWDLRSGALLRQMPKNFPHVTALEWSPTHNLKSLKKKLTQEGSSAGQSQASTPTQSDPMSTSTSSLDSAGRGDNKQNLNLMAREHFVFTDTDGLLYHFIVEGNMIKDGSKIPPDGGMGSITCIAWKGDTMVLGDVDGNLNLWDLKGRVSRAVPTHRGWIKKIKFAPGRANMKLLVLYNDGVDVWDTSQVDLVSSIKSPKEVAKVTDVDWAASDKPVLACVDGCVRIMDIKFRNGCSPIEEHQLADPVFCPHLLTPKGSLTLKYLLQHQPWNKEFSLQLDETDENRDIHKAVNEQLVILDSDLKEYLPLCHFGTAQRSLLTARLFGDESEINFWTVALHYLRAEKAEPMSKSPSRQVLHTESSGVSGDIFIPSTPAKETQDLLMLEEDQERSGRQAWMMLRDKPLETCYDILCDCHTFQKYQLDRIALHDSKRATYEHTRKCAENLIFLGQADRAVQLLLETESDNDSYYVDCLRACLVASIRSSGASQSTIKLVATNLIANGKLSEGVQLLCLIDKGMDACRYLQTYGQWYQAAWLAKATLSYTECAEVMKRWADHLGSSQVNQKSKAILVMLSLGQFVRVVEMLYGMRHFDRAALFVEACVEFGLLERTEETGALLDAVFLEYARILVSLGNRKAAEYYCDQAGQKGKQLLKEIENMFS